MIPQVGFVFGYQDVFNFYIVSANRHPQGIKQ